MAGTHSNSKNATLLTTTTSSSTSTLNAVPTAVHLEKKRSLSPESTEQVRVVDIKDFEKAAECLSQAFAVDEVARYFLDTDDMAACSEEVKYKLHCDIIRYMTAAHCYKGIVTTIGPDYDAVALWLPPGENVDDFFTTIRSGMWRLYYQLSPEGRHRFFTEFMPLLHDTKHDIMGDRDDDSYYLVYLGSKPSARGKGYARKLIEHMTSRADIEGKATYLESSSVNNLPYYKKYGFEEKLDIVLSRGPKPVYLHIMVREPVPVHGTGNVVGVKGKVLGDTHVGQVDVMGTGGKKVSGMGEGRKGAMVEIGGGRVGRVA